MSLPNDFLALEPEPCSDPLSLVAGSDMHRLHHPPTIVQQQQVGDAYDEARALRHEDSLLSTLWPACLIFHL